MIVDERRHTTGHTGNTVGTFYERAKNILRNDLWYDRKLAPGFLVRNGSWLSSLVRNYVGLKQTQLILLSNL